MKLLLTLLLFFTFGIRQSAFGISITGSDWIVHFNLPDQLARLKSCAGCAMLSPMNPQGELIRKTVGRPLSTRSPLARLQSLIISSKPFTKNRIHDEPDRVPVRKVVGHAR